MVKVHNPIHASITNALEPAGFRKKGNSWVRVNNDVVELVNVQKSRFGNQYYVNYAIWLLLLGVAPLSESKYHIRMRIDDIVGASGGLRDLLDLDADIGMSERQGALHALLVDPFLPFVNKCRSVEGIRSMLDEGAFQNAMVHVQARALLAQVEPGAGNHTNGT